MIRLEMKNLLWERLLKNKKKKKTIEDQGQKQVEAFNTLKSNNQLTVEDVICKSVLNNDEAKKELDKIKEIEQNVYRENLVYETN